MKNRFYSIAFIILSSFAFNGMQSLVAKTDPTVLIDEKVSPTLKKILEVTNITHDGTLQSVVEATQKAWLRKAGAERWDIDDSFEKFHDTLYPLFRELDILDEIAPSKKAYDYAIVLGATVNPIRDRLNLMLKAFERGVRYKKLIFHTGARKRHSEKESKEVLFDRNNKLLPIRSDWKEPKELPKTEAEIARMVYDQAALPKGFKEAVEVIFVEAPMQKKPDGTFRNPNTGDIIKLWLSSNTPPGTVLASSNQPYVKYQHAVLKTLLPDTFIIETIGSGAGDKLHVGTLLDNLARWLYQENKYQQSKN